MGVSIGFVILSHRGDEFLARLIKALDREYDRPAIVVHHDFGQAEIATDRFGSNVRFVRPHVRTSWASISVVKAALKALYLLYRDDDPDWVFLLSAQDYPAMSGERVRAELEQVDVDAFIDVWPTETDTAAKAAIVGGCNPALAHFGLEGYRRMRWKLQFRQQIWIPILRLRPRLRIGRQTWRLPVKAAHPFHRDFASYYGDLWFAANRKAVKILLDPSEEDLALQRYSVRRFLPEEGYFAIALANRPGLRLNRDNRRFVKWEGGDHPKLLESADLDEMEASNAFFARKFGEDEGVLEAIDERLSSSPASAV